MQPSTLHHADLYKTLHEELISHEGFHGDLLFDETSKILYSTDASIYQIMPLGVAIPHDQDDLSAIIRAAFKLSIPVLPRGSGSSLAGQAIGEALIVDCSKYLNKILELDPEQQTATVEPGVILTNLNKAAGRYGLQFGPDPASAERASLGGSIANNAAGAHSIVYGMTGDHLLESQVILSDGSEAIFKSQKLEAIYQIISEHPGTRLAQIYSCGLEIREKYRQEIQNSWPLTWRRVSGYNLNYLIPWSPGEPPQWRESSRTWQKDGRADPLAYPPVNSGELNLAQILAGSEGTLAVIKSAKLRLVPRPKHTILGVLAFSSISEACDAVPDLLEKDPSAIELIPQSLIRLSRSVPAYASQLSFVSQMTADGSDPAALLVVEFSGDSPGQLVSQVNSLHSSVYIAETSQAQKNVWAVRKVGLGILQSRPGSKKPIAFMEDMAVPVDRLGAFVRGIDEILADYKTSADYYAHASAGCLHIRPILSLRGEQDIRNMRDIAQRSVDLTLKLGGAVSAEHGDGLARSEWLEQAYGRQITEAFGELKRAADPNGLLNPGKIINPQPMDHNLRYGSGYAPQAWLPVFRFAAGEDLHDEMGLIDAVEQCNGAGVCRKSDGVMCPSFQASGDEMHSTRGRANLLRAMMTGKFPNKSMAEQSVREALDLCLACKGCKSECPSGVDVARLKYEFFSRYYSSGHLRPFRDFLFGYIDLFARLGSPFHWVVNYLLSSQFFAWIGETWLGLSSERPFPRFSAKPLQNLWRAKEHPSTNQTEQVLFLSDAFTEYFHPEAGLAALNLLELAGCNIKILPVLGTGRTLISKGFLKPARLHAERLLQTIQELDPDGNIPIVGVEPSEIYTLRDEYQDFFPAGYSPHLDADKIAQRSWMIDEFLLRQDGNGMPRIDKIFHRSSASSQQEKSPILLHGHCYQKAQPPAADGFPIGASASHAILEMAGYAVQTIDSGCCGMAGAFGYEKEHYHFSQSVGELSLFPAIRNARLADPGIPVAAAGISCQAQVVDGVGGEIQHPIQFVYEAYRTLLNQT